MDISKFHALKQGDAARWNSQSPFWSFLHSVLVSDMASASGNLVSAAAAMPATCLRTDPELLRDLHRDRAQISDRRGCSS